jgi:hypothetical protein
MSTTVQAEEYEEALIQILRRLPPERVSEVFDFAQFLEFRAAKAGEGTQEHTDDDARWDALLATEESQHLLKNIADEALSEIEAGDARPMVFTEDGQIGTHDEYERLLTQV